MSGPPRYLSLLVAVSLLGLGGCASKGDKPRALSPGGSAGTAPTGSPSPLGPEAQVDAAVRHYFDTANQALATGDTRALVMLSDPGCSCRKLVDFIRMAYANGGRLKGARFEISSLLVQEVQGTAAAVDVRYVDEATQQLDRGGGVVSQGRQRVVHDQISMVREVNSWTVSQSVNLERS